jgi:hypothetical protein
MNTVPGLLSRAVFLRWIAVVVVALGALCPLQAQSQVPPRFYWKTLSGANAVPLIVTSMSGNTNPFDPANIVVPGANDLKLKAHMDFVPGVPKKVTFKRPNGVVYVATFVRAADPKGK